jgi:predicted RNA-binding protein with PUA-like domain
MRDGMSVGDGILFYHSSCAVPGVAGIAEVASCPYPDATQFDASSHYYDPKATLEQPRWISVDVRALEKGRYLPLSEMRSIAALEDMVLLQKGSRLSISPVTPAQWNAIVAHVRGEQA